MFTFFCWLFLATFSSVNANCWFAGKTRNTEEVCYGDIRPLPPGLARAANVPEETTTCLRHRRLIETRDNRCSSPLLESERHSRKLIAIPVRLYDVLDSHRENNYRPGSKWCHACRRKFYNEAEAEVDITKRRKKNEASTTQCSGKEDMQELYRRETEKCCTLQRQLNETKQQLTDLQESTIDKQVEAFQKAMYKHQQTSPDEKIYSPEEMRKFTDKYSPGIFQNLLNCITGNRKVTKKRSELQEQRVVSLLHIIAYFRSQKTSALQKDSGLFAASCGLSLQGLSAGQILGFSATPRAVQQLKATLSKEHANYISQQLHRANELTCFMVLMLDDFHNIHSRHTPANLVRTNVVHMASCLVDVHPTIRAVPRPESSTVHRRVVLNVNGLQQTCLGGINTTAIHDTLTKALVNMKDQFLEQLPPFMSNMDPGRLQAALRELRLI